MTDQAEDDDCSGASPREPGPGPIERVSSAPVSGESEIGAPRVAPGGPQIARQVYTEFRASAGVLTDPRSIAEYERAVPGAGQLILNEFFVQAQKEGAHRQACEARVIDADIEQDRALMKQGYRAQMFGFIIVVLGFIMVGYALHLGYPFSASVIATAVLGSTATTFIYGRKKQADEVIATQSNRETPPHQLPPKDDGGAKS